MTMAAGPWRVVWLGERARVTMEVEVAMPWNAARVSRPTERAVQQ